MNLSSPSKLDLVQQLLTSRTFAPYGLDAISILTWNFTGVLARVVVKPAAVATINTQTYDYSQHDEVIKVVIEAGYAAARESISKLPVDISEEDRIKSVKRETKILHDKVAETYKRLAVTGNLLKSAMRRAKRDLMLGDITK